MSTNHVHVDVLFYEHILGEFCGFEHDKLVKPFREKSWEERDRRASCQWFLRI